MDIFDKIKHQDPKESQQSQTIEQQVGSFFVKKGDTYYCTKPHEVSYFSDGQVEFPQKPKSTFMSRQRAKSFYRKTILYFESTLREYMEENLYSGKEFDFSCLSVEKQRKLFHLASESIDVAEFLHKKGFDFDNVIKNSSFAGDLSEVKIYTNIIVYLQNKNVCDKNGTPLIAGVTNADDFMHVLRYKADIDFCKNGKSLKDYVIEKGKPEIIEVAFACGIIGITRNELMELEGINSPRRRYCPFLDMLKTEILDSEKQIKSDTCKITTKKELELSAKAEIEKLFEDAQTSVK